MVPLWVAHGPNWRDQSVNQGAQYKKSEKSTYQWALRVGRSVPVVGVTVVVVGVGVSVSVTVSYLG